jgi:tetratricopeptide (TPR) repeat protein
MEAFAGEIRRTVYLTWLAKGYGGAGRVEEGLATIAEALRLVEKNDERFYEAEVYRLRGELTLAQSSVQRLASGVQKNQKSKNPDPQSQILDPESEAEGCFLRAVEIAQKQQAKSLELRAVKSLARLWQSQGKHAEARQMLADVYGWFTEAFGTKDLQVAKALLADLA